MMEWELDSRERGVQYGLYSYYTANAALSDEVDFFEGRVFGSGCEHLRQALGLLEYEPLGVGASFGLDAG